MKLSQALANLWRRARWWRFCLLSAITLTLIFVLFPPERGTDTGSLPALPADVRYAVPNPASGTVAVAHASAAGAKAAVAPPAPSPAPTTAAAPTAKPAALVKPATAPAAAPQTQPQVAQIAMANVSPADTLSGVDPTQISRTAHGVIVVKGFSIQLPPGEWMTLSHGEVKGAVSGEKLILGRIEHKKLLGLVEISAGRTLDLSKNDFTGLEACAPGGGQDKLSIHCEVNTPNVAISAWLIGHMFTPPLAQWANKSIKIDPMMRAAAGDLAAKGVTYDQDYVQVNFARRETWGYLQVFYYFDPSTEGIASSNAMSFGDTDWAVDRIKHFPEKQAYVEKIEGWASKQWPDFKRAFDEAEKG